MKDALGHGSDGNGAAARSLASGPKSAPVATHSAMAAGVGPNDPGVGPNDPRAGSRDYDAFGRVRSADSKAEYDNYNRDLWREARGTGKPALRRGPFRG